MKRLKRAVCFLLSLVMTAFFAFSATVFATDETPVLSDNLKSTEKENPFYNIVCTYDGNGRIKLEYRMKNNYVKRYSESLISVYALTSGQTVESIISGELEPIQTDIAPSNRNTVEINAATLSERLSQYVLAVGSEDGKICSEPIYPAVQGSVACESGFKGICSADDREVIDALASSVIVEIDTDRLESSAGGYIYPTYDRTFIFDSSYIKEIDRKIKLYGGAGCDIYLRLNSGSGNRNLFTGHNDSRLAAYAYASFLYIRYSDEEYTGLTGIILGDRSNTSHNSYASGYAAALYSAASGIGDVGGNCATVVPISDGFNVISDFLPSLCDELESCNGMIFSVMTEIRRSPFGITADYIDNYNNPDEEISEQLSPATISDDIISAENVSKLRNYLILLSENYKTVQTDFICFWEPDNALVGDAATAAYIYSYYALFFNGSVKSFFISTGNYGDSDIERLSEAIRYIDSTKRTEYIDDNILKYFGYGEPFEAINNFSASRLIQSRINSTELNNKRPNIIIGSYDYFDFSSTAGLTGWYGGVGCNGVSSGKNSFGKAMTARLDISDGSAFAVYNYKYTESFLYTDYISVRFSAEETDKAGEYVFFAVIGGDDYEYEYTLDGVEPGRIYTVHLNVSGLNENTAAEYLRLGLKKAENSEAASETRLFIYSICAESTVYDNQTLSGLIESERERLRESVADPENGGVNRMAILFIVAVVLVTAVIMIMISRRRRLAKTRQIAESI